ncbi:MAG: YciI family protein [Thermoanaerobaculia bacterium]|nr:YciI family protein [Thermoanaerobaculia bacterium]
MHHTGRTAFIFFLLALSLLSSPLAATEPATAAEDEEVAPSEFEKHYLVLLIRPENPPTFSDEESAKIQSAHLGHLHKLWVEGDALIAGPFEVPKDERMRGMVLFRGDLSAAEVRALAEADPAVKAGRLEVQVLPWWHGKDLIDFAPPPSGSV